MAIARVLDPATEQVARSFLSEVQRQYDVAGAYVFGSQARGDATLKTGIRVDALPLWESEWGYPETFNNPDLIDNIRREGIRL